MFRGTDQIRDAYRRDSVAREYVQTRFVQPLGAVLHARHLEVLVRQIERERPRRILEVAPGPARLTVDVARVFGGVGVMVDASMQMLAEARRRMNGGPVWNTTQADAFSLPFACEFDLVYSFRLIRHFEADRRVALYREIARVLKPNGLLVFDVVNETVSAPLRARAQPGEYEHYDALLRPDVLRDELESAGLRLVSLDGVQHSFTTLQRIQILIGPRAPRLARQLISAIDRFGMGEPLEWVATCRRA